MDNYQVPDFAQGSCCRGISPGCNLAPLNVHIGPKVDDPDLLRFIAEQFVNQIRDLTLDTDEYPELCPFFPLFAEGHALILTRLKICCNNLRGATGVPPRLDIFKGGAPFLSNIRPNRLLEALLRRLEWMKVLQLRENGEERETAYWIEHNKKTTIGSLGLQRYLFTLEQVPKGSVVPMYSVIKERDGCIKNKA